MPSLYYRDDEVPSYAMNNLQKKSLKNFMSKLKSGKYDNILIKCICGNSESTLLLKISQKDRYGIPVDFFLCKICGLIFQRNPLSNQSLTKFYTNDYNKLYKGGIKSLDILFEKALKRGNRFYKLIKQLDILKDIESVYESGCSIGANLYPFHLDNKVVCGFDYDENLLNYGRKKGLLLYNFDKIEKKEKYDLIISSHVLEHVLNPIEYLKDQIENINVGKYFLLEVPGVFCFHKNNNKIIDNLVNAHIFYFHKAFLINIAKKIGLKPIYSDQFCTFIFQKMSYDKYDNRIDFDNYNGKFWYKKIKNYLDILYLKEQLGLIKLNNSLSKINLFLRIRLKIILKNLKLYN